MIESPNLAQLKRCVLNGQQAPIGKHHSRPALCSPAEMK